MKSRLLFVVLAVAATGCVAPTTQRSDLDAEAVAREQEMQRQVAVDSWVRDTERLYAVSLPIMDASVEFCADEVKPAVGFWALTRHNWEKEYQSAVTTLYGLGDTPEVFRVFSGTPAEEAGMLEGDVILAINTDPVPVGSKALERLEELMTKNFEAGIPVSITVKRSNMEQELKLTPRLRCAYSTLIQQSDSVNAYADGENIVITTGMMRFARNDQELALIVAHELAHNAMNHISAKRVNTAGGTMLDILAALAGVNTQGAFGKMAGQAYSQEFEAEADYVGLYMMARANLDLDGAPMFWRRMATAHPGSIEGSILASHPATPERFVAIEETVKEINGKRALGQKLEPEYKEVRKSEALPRRTEERGK